MVKELSAGVLGLIGVFGVRIAFGEGACVTMLSKLWEAFAKNRIESAMVASPSWVSN